MISRLLPSLAPGPNSFLLSYSGLIYNTPALLFLGLLFWKRPLWGALLTALSFGRVFLGWVPWSMHMMIACFALLASRSRWMRVLAAFLLAMTTYYYLGRFQDVWGWLLSGGMGLLAALLDHLYPLLSPG
ncbi:hypothetical protein BSZ35_00145 [Salinibacter sp. 10B]|uniref:hypothetical protein n=1 Tax=Salinibacter sp. 10B TaxID=1923971 RepID=UPI000CF368B1|nr:hypothetical protein [Salinibacter sp. 10B]PQJ36800.1 hypothetical protein BSZ35_00145 [Salinibacter sp. 10B]